jgi:predicted nucleotide-binding protein
MDHEAVIDEIVSRAGGHDPKAIEDAELAPIREAFAGQKENAISILSAVLSVTSDAFLQNKLEEIEKLKAPDPSTIARRLVPNGQIFTRDTLALTQKLRIAPHQSVSAFPLSAGVTASAIDGLERAARLSASHLQRLEQGKQKASVTGMTIFIGHGKSPVWRELRDFLEKRLHLSVDEFNSVPVAGISTVIRLEEMLNAAAFAFVVMTAEDELPDGKLHARLNVVHEAGLFQGRLGFKKAIILLEEGCEEFSNIHGLGQIRFPKSGISAKFEEIRSVLEREGLAASPTASR